MEPQVLFHHPLLDGRFGPAERIRVMQDGDIRALIDDFVAAAKRARDIGFDFVDLKHCHGYLGHEFLAAKTRPGDYGGSLENRTRFLRELVAGIRAEAPGLEMGVHIFDASVAGLGGCPYAKGATGNVATEDVVFLLNGLGIETGIDLDALADAGAWISAQLGRPPVSRVGRALLAKKTVA
jgi:hypothetical protein